MRVSADARALVSPAAAFRDLAEETNGGTWVLMRRPLWLLLAIGSTVSILAGGRLTARLVLDGAISFAFIPVFEIAALAVVVRRMPQRPAFARAVDLLFAATGPWIAWMVAASALASAVAVENLPRWTSRPRDWIVAAASAAAIAWFVRIEFHVFRDGLARSRAEAVRDLALHRSIAWSAETVYFFGFALWPMIVGMLR
jgi:hypothetical protein